MPRNQGSASERRRGRQGFSGCWADPSSTLGYTPLSDVGLLAGARLLIEGHSILELGRTVELFKALQKQDPKFVRFTVDRMGMLAYVKFLKTKQRV